MTSTDDLDRNLARAGELVRAAAERGARLVTLPENVAFIGGDDGKLATAEAFDLGPVTANAGKIARWASELARETQTWLLLGGVAERTPDERKVYNAAVMFDALGRITACYRKIHLFEVKLADGTERNESRLFVPGTTPVVVDTPLGRVGMSICFDVRFPELYRKLVDEGATVLTVPATFTVTTGRDHWHVLLRARAIESQAYVIAPAQWGENAPNRPSYGHALICDPWGTIVSECPDGEGFAIAPIDLDRVASLRNQLPALACRRL
jgi:predicted amidohydrolase